jgi:hypothetical protein
VTTENETEAPAADSLDAINQMDYAEMLDAWMTGSLDLTPGTPESNAFNARFQKLRAELPTEELNTDAGNNNRRNGKSKKKAGKHHGKRR